MSIINMELKMVPCSRPVWLLAVAVGPGLGISEVQNTSVSNSEENKRNKLLFNEVKKKHRCL